MITKQETVERLTSRDNELFKYWEAKIDAALQSALSLPVCVDITSIETGTLDSIESAYRKSGWTVQYIADPRNGEVLRLS